MLRMALLLPWVMALAPQPLAAASSGWHEVEGGGVRIVTEEFASAGRLRGVLEIRLAPGWKTYWQDPGESGVPPQVELVGGGAGTHVTIRFPPPKRIGDGQAAWAGYDESVLLALELPPDSPVGLSADVFLGICQTICIPVSAQLQIASNGRSDPREAEIIRAAFARLPAPANGDFRVIEARIDAESLDLRLALPETGMAAELFLADGGGWKFGVPQKVAGEPDRLIVPIHARPDDHHAADLPYTLVGEHRAVEGRLQIGGRN